MRSPEIQKLVDTVEAAFGVIELYGSSLLEEHGTAFTIEGIPATFSVITLEDALPSGRYDIQIEGSPPGDYLYAAEVSLSDFIKLVSQMQRPEVEWPRMHAGAS